MTLLCYSDGDGGNLNRSLFQKLSMEYLINLKYEMGLQLKYLNYRILSWALSIVQCMQSIPNRPHTCLHRLLFQRQKGYLPLLLICCTVFWTSCIICMHFCPRLNYTYYVTTFYIFWFWNLPRLNIL